MSAYNLNLKGKSISLRKLRLSDDSSIFHNVSDRTITKGMGSFPYPFPMERVHKMIRRSLYNIRAGKGYALGIVPNDIGQVVGIVSIDITSRKNKCGSVAYWIGKDYRRKGYTSEAVRLMLSFGFKMLKLHRIEISHFSNNDASKGLIQKSGFRFEGIARKSVLKGKRWLDLCIYSMLQNEFKA